MKLLILVVVVLAIAGTLLAAAKKGGGKASEKPKARKPMLTKNEQPMYFRLQEALPEHQVLAQVAFSALLTATQRAARSTFNRKVADFVICTKAFEVVAVVELDDSSHKGKEEADRKREGLLTEAGYRVLRYRRTPDIEQIRKDITEAPRIDSLRGQA